MVVPSGTRFGRYSIVAPLGAGGMGEVYRALDTRLDRTVAIKVLRETVAAHTDHRRRFELEARAVSSLNHPHICALYDVGEQDGVSYLVMEYVEGQTLAKRLEAGALPIEQTLRHGFQIAQALGLAHRQGVFHRDLKPGNIMLTKSGAKLLDFGLAKLRPAASGGGTTSLSETLTLTAEGTVLGTLPYMAPEQVEGKETDGGADIFSFGAVLYEMATGRRAFAGDSPAALISAILSSDPAPITAADSMRGHPQALLLERLIRKCLAKSPEDRWQGAQDLASELQWIAEAGAAFGVPGTPGKIVPTPRRRRERLAWATAAVAVVAALLLTVVHVRRPQPGAPPVRFVVAPPEKTTLTGTIAVSPDGKRVAFVATAADGATSLWVRPLESLTGRPLPETGGALHPFWSPDGQYLGYFVRNRGLFKIRAEGGPPQLLAPAFDARGGTWSRQGVIVYSPNDRDPLNQIPEGGGTATPVTTLEASREETSHQWPCFLPDGRRFLYLVWSAQAEARGVYLGSLDRTGPSRRLVSADWGVAYAGRPGGGGYLLLLRGTTLLAQPFDFRNARLTGEPLPVGEQVWHDETTPGLASFSVSENGVLAYRSGGIRTAQMTWFDRAGRPLTAVGEPGAYSDPSLSPDERSAAASRIDPQTGTQDIVLIDLSRDIVSRFTFHPRGDAFPLWSPDGRHIVFASDREGTADLYQKAASGLESEGILLRSPVSKYPTGWARDGRHIVFANWDPKTSWDLWVLPMTGDRKPMPYLHTDFDAFQAQFSPDGRWVAYVSNESNPQYEVYVQPFPMAAGRWQISTKGGSQPSWRGDGRELYYLSPNRTLMAVDVVPGVTFGHGAPRPLFQTQVPGLVNVRNHYAPAADGRRFLVNTLAGEATTDPITIVLNWTAGLPR